jgi:hypothetical protein
MYRIEGKTWFAVLLIGGLLGLASGLIGFAAMVAYIVAGLDGMAERPQIPMSTQRQGELLPAS